MILDKRNEFCDATTVNTGAAGSYLLGDQIDLGAAGLDVGNGEPVYLVITVDTGIKVASSTGTISFSLVSDDSASIATNGTATVHAVSASFATSTTSDAGALKAGNVLLAVPLPMEGTTYERYLGILQTTGTTAISAGKINAFLTRDVQAWKAYDAPFSA